MKNQIMLVMLAMLVTVFVVPCAPLTLLINVGCLAMLVTTLIPLAADAISLHIENRVRNQHSKNIVVKENDGNESKESI